jgi:hypothetical protein
VRGSYAPAAIALAWIWAFNSGDAFKVMPQRLQRKASLLPGSEDKIRSDENEGLCSLSRRK